MTAIPISSAGSARRTAKCSGIAGVAEPFAAVDPGICASEAAAGAWDGSSCCIPRPTCRRWLTGPRGRSSEITELFTAEAAEVSVKQAARSRAAA